MIVAKGSTTLPINKNLNLLGRIEVWDAGFGGAKGNRKVGNLVPMHAEHFGQCKTSGAFRNGATGKPIYFTRTAAGLEIHPATDKDYWFEPFFRKPTPVRPGTVSDDGTMQVAPRTKS